MKLLVGLYLIVFPITSCESEKYDLREGSLWPIYGPRLNDRKSKHFYGRLDNML